jgi:hypothetical protein
VVRSSSSIKKSKAEGSMGVVDMSEKGKKIIKNDMTRDEDAI